MNTVRIEETARMLTGEVRRGVHVDAVGLPCENLQGLLAHRLDEMMHDGGLLGNDIFGCSVYRADAVDEKTGEVLASRSRTFGMAAKEWAH